MDGKYIQENDRSRSQLGQKNLVILSLIGLLSHQN